MGYTKHMLAEAGINENDTVQDGKRGDQVGYELRAIYHHTFDWTHVYRAKEESVREKIADFMERAVINGYIGYSQGDERNTLFRELQKIGFKVETLNTHAHCDCSALAYCAIYNAIGIPFDQTDPSIAPRTKNYVDYLGSTNKFDDITSDDYLGTMDNLVRGDIVFKPTVHVAVFI